MLTRSAHREDRKRFTVSPVTEKARSEPQMERNLLEQTNTSWPALPGMDNVTEFPD